jgi:hypothetical protein
VLTARVWVGFACEDAGRELGERRHVVSCVISDDLLFMYFMFWREIVAITYINGFDIMELDYTCFESSLGCF